MLDFVLRMMDFVLRMMDFVLRMMDFVLRMMDFVLKMMDCDTLTHTHTLIFRSASRRLKHEEQTIEIESVD